MSEDLLTVLQVSWAAQNGGAERVAYSLHQGLRRRGHDAWMAVSVRNIEEPEIISIPATLTPGHHLYSAARAAMEGLGQSISVTRRLGNRLSSMSSLGELLDYYSGREHFGYPSTRGIPDLPPRRPHIIHCHNLHGRYFDLRQLSTLSRTFPVAVTLHDEWLYTGHCAGTLGCERWRSGCGSCPHLGTYPPIRRDATSRNWRVKRDVFAASRLYVAGPSQWIIARARESMLAPGAVDWRVIHNGVDRSIFRPGNQMEARRRLDVPRSSVVLLFVANYARTSLFKDYPTVAAAARMVAESLPEMEVLLLVVGEEGPTERIGNCETRFVPFQRDPETLAQYYRAADLYLHGSRAESAGFTILEAVSSGLPVVATAVGGVPEGIKSLAGMPGSLGGPAASLVEATGVLVEPGDAAGMASASVALLSDYRLRATLAKNASRDAANRFDLERQVDVTLSWYRTILEERASRSQIGRA